MNSEKYQYFERREDTPPPIEAQAEKKIQFSEADPMGVVWHGRYPRLFEIGYSELTEKCGLTYRDLYETGLAAPIVEYHIDYHKPIPVGERIKIKALLVWSEAAKMNIEYQILNRENDILTTGYSRQLFVDAESEEPVLVVPEILKRVKDQWREGKL